MHSACFFYAPRLFLHILVSEHMEPPKIFFKISVDKTIKLYYILITVIVIIIILIPVLI